MKRPADRFDIQQHTSQFQAHNGRVLLLVPKTDVSISLFPIVRKLVCVVVPMITGLVEAAGRLIGILADTFSILTLIANLELCL